MSGRVIAEWWKPTKLHLNISPSNGESLRSRNEVPLWLWWRWRWWWRLLGTEAHRVGCSRPVWSWVGVVSLSSWFHPLFYFKINWVDVSGLWIQWRRLIIIVIIMLFRILLGGVWESQRCRDRRRSVYRWGRRFWRFISFCGKESKRLITYPADLYMVKTAATAYDEPLWGHQECETITYQGKSDTVLQEGKGMGGGKWWETLS